MNKKFTVMLLSITLIAASCEHKIGNSEAAAPKNAMQKSKEKAKPEIASENLEKVEYTIKGMTCAYGCAKMIEKKLAGSDGVQSARVDFESGKATVSFDKTLQSRPGLKKTIEGLAGGTAYKVSEGNSKS